MDWFLKILMGLYPIHDVSRILSCVIFLFHFYPTLDVSLDHLLYKTVDTDTYPLLFQTEKILLPWDFNIHNYKNNIYSYKLKICTTSYINNTCNI